MVNKNTKTEKNRKRHDGAAPRQNDGGVGRHTYTPKSETQSTAYGGGGGPRQHVCSITLVTTTRLIC